MIEHCKRYKAIKSAIKKLEKQAHDFQKVRFPVGTSVHVIAPASCELVPCKVATYYAGLENADRAIVSADTEDGAEKLRGYRLLGREDFDVPISQMLNDQAAANYRKALSDVDWPTSNTRASEEGDG